MNNQVPENMEVAAEAATENTAIEVATPEESTEENPNDSTQTATITEDVPAEEETSEVTSTESISETEGESSEEVAAPQQEEVRVSPTIRPLRLFELLKYDNVRHAKKPVTVDVENPDANARVLTRKPRSVWNIG